MKFTRNSHFYIATNKMDSVFNKTKPLNYEKWVDFVGKNQDEFIWFEKTKNGIELAMNIDNVPVNFRDGVLAGLHKVRCFKEFDDKKGYYNITCTFDTMNNRISIGFERTPKLNDLKIFVEMAKNLDALLLKDGKEIIDERTIRNVNH